MEDVELGLYVLRRSASAPVRRWGRCPAGLAWELRDSIERRGSADHLERLLGGFPGRRSSSEVVSQICDLVERGTLEAVAWRGSASTLAETDEPTDLVELLPVQPLPATEAENEPDLPVETPLSTAKVATLEAAANAGSPFCEICEKSTAEEAAAHSQAARVRTPPGTGSSAQRRRSNPTAPPADAGVDEVAQLASFLRASEDGMPFCQICERETA